MKTVLRSLTAAVLAGAALTTFAPGEVTAAATALHDATSQNQQDLTVRVLYPASTAGEIWIGLYDSQAAYDGGDEIHSRTISAASDELAALIEDLPVGEYGIVAFHDANSDGDFNMNFIGIPAERYGFSNNTRPRFRRATWQEVRFELTADGPREVTIELMGAMG